ncbi:MAG: DUF302 domain-containing protein [Magnetococcales bacterium]|nr:DUF302 domain-containing protein [Magnetococcales bacterium]
MSQAPIDYAIVKAVAGSYEETVEAARKALADQGFGILSEIDVAATLKNKLGADTPRTLILGACNPPMALRATTAVPDIAVFLPCNVVIRESAQGVEVSAMDPKAMGRVIDNPEVTAVAGEVDQKIRAALDALPGR